MLYDKARIHVQGGAGGSGCMSFRREAHVPRGGPDGGDGGRGGAIVLLCDDSLRDLQSFKRKAHYKAPRAGHGQGALRHGASGDDLIVRVPPGTQVTLADGTEYDLVTPGQRVVAARGGLGGRGNKHFASPTRQAPRFSERGLPGDEGWIDLRLKLLADVGLIGLPNAGKSSLLARMTRAAPKIGSYPFTTLEPVLGTLDASDRQLIVADIPGLIEGASEGHGLGHEFLAHVERTRLLVHVLELAPLDGSDPVDNHRVIEAELASYDQRLARLPRVLVLSKADLMPAEDAEAARELWAEHVGEDVPVLVTSSATGHGVDDLSELLLRSVPVEKPAPAAAEAAAADGVALAEHRTFKPAADRGFTVERADDGTFRVTGPRVERLMLRFDVENEEAAAHVEHRLDRMGVLRALEENGFAPGDDVEIGGVLVDLDPGE
ncbi:MAG: GTP-binding protein Obg [uncultured Solirubrobacteraceae bacterium]|uniref:GTPase Obg n=1 Tax=uncultured Solirubrobacteraceae bacterium TaxID=1162706 RepID=A0A6J4S966_9ACTN|nr:MAG: GTP-binding protein Obg [uncultured Solirubrobacteraceae bacterium]